MKKIVTNIAIGIAVLFVVGIVIERVFPAQVHRRNLVSSTEELGIKITEELMDGHDSFSVYVRGLSENDLVMINHRLDGFFGHVNSYTILRKMNSEVSQIRFELEVSNNYYVYQKLVNGKEIENNMDAEILSVKVQQVLDECQANSDYEKVVKYHDYIVTHTQYELMEGEDEVLSFTAAGALLHGRAVCNGYAEAMELLLLCGGVESYMAVGTTDDGDHAWNIVNIDGQWYHVDTTWDDPVPDMGKDALHVYLNVDDDIMSKSHTWNHDAYPVCENMDYNYYEREAKAFDSFNDFKVYVLGEMKTSNRIEVMVTDSDSIQYDCGFVVKEGGAREVTWQSYEDGDYMVMLISYE